MRVYVKVIARSSQKKVERISEGDFKVWVQAVPEKGKANKEVVEVLADYFKIAKSQIKIVGGTSSSKKIVDIE